MNKHRIPFNNSLDKVFNNKSTPIVYLWGAKPGNGKTSALVNVANNAVNHISGQLNDKGKSSSIIFVTCEETKTEIEEKFKMQTGNDIASNIYICGFNSENIASISKIEEMIKKVNITSKTRVLCLDSIDLLNTTNKKQNLIDLKGMAIKYGLELHIATQLHRDETYEDETFKTAGGFTGTILPDVVIHVTKDHMSITKNRFGDCKSIKVEHETATYSITESV